MHGKKFNPKQNKKVTREILGTLNKRHETRSILYTGNDMENVTEQK